MDPVKSSPATTYVGLRFGNYLLYEFLGRGGFAQIYLGKHRYLGTWATVKIPRRPLSAEEINRFFREARTAADLVHPHIVRVLEFGFERNIPYLVMDYAPYGTLRQLHPEYARLPMATILKYLRQIAEALQYIHDRGYVHRDIKPDNILLGPHSEIWLSDFGITTALHQRATSADKERFGTVIYMAPEQIQGQPGFASDQYALAVMVYEWLCGEVPFTGSTREIAIQHVTARPPAPRSYVPAVSAEVENVVLRALEKDPQERFSSVQEFAIALERAHRHTLQGKLRQQTEKLERLAKVRRAVSMPRPTAQSNPARPPASPGHPTLPPKVPYAAWRVRQTDPPAQLRRLRSAAAPKKARQGHLSGILREVILLSAGALVVLLILCLALAICR